VKNKFFKKKPDLALALNAEAVSKSVDNTYQGSLFIPMEGVHSKVKDAQGNTLNHFQKPTDLFGFFIECLSVPGQTILEYCAGSGTGLIASLERDRNYIGFDSSETQFIGASKRAQKLLEKNKSVKSELSDNEDEKEEEKEEKEKDQNSNFKTKTCCSCDQTDNLTEMETCGHTFCSECLNLETCSACE
jgi:DNA modification methylase